MSGAEGYQAVRERVGLIDLAGRSKVGVYGPDRVSFLHSMISNDVEGLEEWSGNYATLLTARGKMVADFFYYRLPEFVLIDMGSDLSGRFISTLEKYIIMDDVELRDCGGEFDHLSLQGPASPGLIEELLGCQVPEKEFRIERARWKGTEVWVVCRGRLADSGFELIAQGSLDALRDHLARQANKWGLEEVGAEALEQLRLEAGIPKFGLDMSEKNYPMEARLDHALSLDKGCYIGQEVVARATHIGGVARHLVRLKIDSNEASEPGGRIFSEDEKEVGWITSSCYSPRAGGAIALGYVKRIFSKPGTAVKVGSAAGGTCAAKVVEAF